MHKHLLVSALAVSAVFTLGNGAAQAAEDGADKQKVHTVMSGESLSAIATNEKLESWRILWNANTELTDPNLIYPGQKLSIPADPASVPERPIPANVDTSALPPAPVAAPVAPAPAVKAAPKTTYTAPVRPAVRPQPNYAQGAAGIFERIRQRESNGNYAINTGNGYYGAYQFDLRTWQSVGGSGLPSDASPAEQDMRAKILYDRRGCQPWPNTCY